MKSRWTIGRAFLVLLLACQTLRAGTLGYNRDVRPILSENCFPCHGAHSAARKANLRLDRFDDAIRPRKHSQPAILPNNARKRALVTHNTETYPDDLMPPTITHYLITLEQR